MITHHRRSTAAIGAMLAMALSAPPALAHGWGHRRHHDRIDAGDVLTGVLIVGGIIAIASAGSSSNRDRDRRRSERDDRDDYPRQRAEAYPPAQPIGWDQGGVGAAVDRCMNEIAGPGSRDAVESVARAGEGWRVLGRTERGQGFSCTVDGSGRIRNIQIEGEG